VNGSFVIIAGQHICKALWLIRKQALETGFELPDWLQVVNAVVLRNSTPVSTLELIGGRCQKVSQNVTHCTIAGLVRLFLRELDRNAQFERAGDIANVTDVPTLWKLAYEKSAWKDTEEEDIHLDVCRVL
jgi:hypothetical protein